MPDRPDRHPSRRRSALVLAGILGGLAVVAAILIVVLVTRENTSAGPDACVPQVIATFGTDDDLAAADGATAGSDDVADRFVEYRDQARERFAEIFDDAPELGEQVPLDAVPASLWLVPADGTSADELADRLRPVLLERGAEDVATGTCVRP